MKIQFPASVRLSFIYIVFLGLLSLTGYSQETGSCAENLKTAQSLFDKGQVDKVPSMISECLKSGFNREESLTAYKLLIQSYLFVEKFGQADSLMLAFLKRNPEYQISPTDHSSFVNLYNSFRVKTVVQISLHLGTNLPYLSFIEPSSLSSEPGKKSYSSEAVNLFISLEAKFQLNKKIDLNVEAGYSQLSFTSSENNFLGIYDISYTETQRRIEIPVSLTYNIASFGKVTPYGRFGIGPALTLSSSAQASSDPTSPNNPFLRTGPNVNTNDLRIRLDLIAQLGAGLKYKTRGGFLFAEARSNMGLLNQVVRGSSVTGDLNNYYFYTDNDFHLNSLNFSIGYTQIFYKPSKKQQ